MTAFGEVVTQGRNSHAGKARRWMNCEVVTSLPAYTFSVENLSHLDSSTSINSLIVQHNKFAQNPLFTICPSVS